MNDLNFIKFLGTGATFPTKYRNVSGIYFKYKNTKIMLDFGEGTQKQLAKYGLDYDIDYVLITHNHLDHYWGLIPFLRTLALRNRVKPLFILGKNINEIQIHFQRVVFDYSNMSYTPIFLEFDKKINIENIQITPIQVKHSIPAIGFLIEISERERLSNDKILQMNLVPGSWCAQILEKREITLNNRLIKLAEIIENEAKQIRIFYSGDTLPIFNNKQLSNLDILIYECTNCDEDLSLSKQNKHTIFSDAIKLKDTYTPKHMFLTHISEKLDYFLRNITLPEDICFAKDGLNLEIK